jgi:4-hydroxy-2-oxoglutarate aldolase
MTKQAELPLHGVFSPIATPFSEDGDVAHDKLESNLAKWNETGLRGYVVLGSNGEFVYLNEKEKRKVLQTARETIPGDKLMIAGTGCESTIETLKLTYQAAKLGADAAIVINPSYFKSQMTIPVLANHFRVIADDSAIPIIIYNFTPGTGIDLAADLLVELSYHPNILGVKDSFGNIAKMGDTIRRADPSFHVLAGSANFFYPSLYMGVTGGILALANIAPREAVHLYRLYKEGAANDGQALHLRLLPANIAVTGRFGVSGLKAALEMMGYYGGPPRLPLLPLDDQNRAELRTILDKAGLNPT